MRPAPLRLVIDRYRRLRDDAAAAQALTVLPMVDCIDLGSRAGVYIMNEEDFTNSVAEHANEDFTTVTKSIVVEALGKNAALARTEAVFLDIPEQDRAVPQVSFGGAPSQPPA